MAGQRQNGLAEEINLKKSELMTWNTDQLYWLMYKDADQEILTSFERRVLKIAYPIAYWSLDRAVKQENLEGVITQLSGLLPDISSQYSNQQFRGFVEKAVRALQAFQCQMASDIFTSDLFADKEQLTMVDIGDSSGLHSLCIKHLLKDKKKIETVSINLDQRAIEKIQSKGLRAILARAEDLELNENFDLLTSFQTVEHLLDPIGFLSRTARKIDAEHFFITLPFFKKSRVGLHHIKTNKTGPVYAEQTHIFELNPHDWSLLFQHSGWKIVKERIYYQYPRRIPVVNALLKWFWRIFDFEGYWGVLLRKDLTVSNYYQDWKDI